MTTPADHTFENHGADGADNSGAPAPGPPAQWPQAGQGSKATDDGKKCGKSAGTGDNGNPGHTGVAGQDAGTPTAGGQIKMNIDEMTGAYSFSVIGGKGGGGGPGGIGGDGQDGGPGGASSKNCSGGKQGEAGAGGLGGDGGKATDGAEAKPIYITYTTGNPAPTFSAIIQPGQGGKGGAPGKGGPAGKGEGGGGTLGPGKWGYTGTGGQAGQLYVNGKPQAVSTGESS